MWNGVIHVEKLRHYHDFHRHCILCMRMRAIAPNSIISRDNNTFLAFDQMLKALVNESEKGSCNW